MMRRLNDSALPRLACGTDVSDSALGRVLIEIWEQQHTDSKRLAALCDDAVERSGRGHDNRGRFWAHLSRALMLAGERPSEASEADLAVATNLVERVRDPRAARLVSICEATLLTHAGLHPAALERFNALPLLSKSGRDDADDHWVLQGRATCAMAIGAIDTAFDALYANLHLAERTGPLVRHWMIAAELARLLMSVEQIDEGVALLEQLLAGKHLPAASTHAWVRVRHAQAAGYLLRQRHDEALATLLSIVDCEVVKASDSIGFQIREDLVRVCVAQVRFDDARRHLDRAYEDAEALGASNLLGACHLQAARLARAEGHVTRAIDLLERALSCFDLEPATVVRSMGHKEAAELLTECYAEAGQFEQAYGCHRRFFDIYRRRVEHVTLGQEAAARCKQSQTAAIEMSVREIDCLRWCAAGKTAWETGQILNLSEWTVVYHLERVKRKFGLSRKQQVVARAISLGLIQPQQRIAA